MMIRELPLTVLSRRALVYVRQSTSAQFTQISRVSGVNTSSLISREHMGFGRCQSSTTIWDDLQPEQLIDQDFGIWWGKSVKVLLERCSASKPSRLARNGRDWHHLLELCGLVDARVIDPDGVYDPSLPNDRLLLGLKGTMSEFELTTLRRRLLDAAIAKARRGELRMPVPVGYVWHNEAGLTKDPDRRIQGAVATIFRLFDRFGSARQVLLHMRKEALVFPRPDGKNIKRLIWKAPVYRNIISVLQNPCYAGAYAYGKSHVQTKIIDGSVRKAYGRSRPRDQWTVLLKDHHEAYVEWEQFERNQDRLSRNSFCKPAGGAKSGRGGRALMAGLLRCRRCGRMLQVTYGGRGIPRPRYTCRLGHVMHGLSPCINFGARRPDDAIAREILLAVQPVAVEAAVVAEQDSVAQVDERRRALELEREQAKYEVQIAARRYEAVDPDNRLVASELEARWNHAIAKLRDCEARLDRDETRESRTVDPATLMALAHNLEAAWSAPTTSMRSKQRLVRALIEEIVVDVDDATREVVLVIHWRGGQHSELRVRKPKTGEYTKRACADAVSVIRDMVTRFSDSHIAATLNRMGFHTGQGNTWSARRVESYRKRPAFLRMSPGSRMVVV